MIKAIFNELNESNSSNYKLDVLKKYKDNELFQRVLKMSYDKVNYTYAASLKAVLAYEIEPTNTPITLEDALNTIEEQVITRKVTGHKSLYLLRTLFNNLSEDDSYVLQRVIDRNVKCNFGTTQINKVFKNLIPKPVYMRCGVFNDKTTKKIKFPALIQVKADGTYREFTVLNNTVTACSRSGEYYVYPDLFNAMSELPEGVYHGELTVKNVTDRSIGNGMINSDDVPYNDLVLDLWDYITLSEYKNAANKIKNTAPYNFRFNELSDYITELNHPQIDVIESHIVQNIQEGTSKVSEWMNKGLEGGVLKNCTGLFKNGTSTDQLKLKIQIDTEMRITGFQEGKLGSKREGKIGSIIFENDEGTVKGKCSGFSDKLLDEMTENKDKYLGNIITVEFNDLSQAKGNDYYALSHPRFIEVRTDKDETDTLQKVLELREMAVNLK